MHSCSAYVGKGFPNDTALSEKKLGAAFRVVHHYFLLTMVRIALKSSLVRLKVLLQNLALLGEAGGLILLPFKWMGILPFFWRIVFGCWCQTQNAWDDVAHVTPPYALRNVALPSATQGLLWRAQWLPLAFPAVGSNVFSLLRCHRGAELRVHDQVRALDLKWCMLPSCVML